MSDHATAVPGASPAAGPEARALRLVRRRLVPFLFCLYVVAYLDRVNVSFAAAPMSADLGFTPATYGLAAGIFFVGYFLVEVPSNLALRRFGARVWIARIMVTWGVVAALQAFVRTDGQFVAVRFLLGVAEAGFFPGIVLYLTAWVPRAERARTLAAFLTAVAVAGVVGSPVSGLLLGLDGTLGLAGWQWLFLVQAVPSVVLGLAVLRWLPGSPADAGWLGESERLALVAAVEADTADAAPSLHGLGAAFRSGRVWALAGLYLLVVTGIYTITLWLPQYVAAELPGAGPVGAGLLAAVPYAVAVAAMPAVGRSSDRRRERAWHVAAPVAVGGAALLAAGPATGPAALVLIAVATAGVYAALAPFWSLPPAFLSGAAAAAGIAWVNAVGNLGGFLGPYSVGRLASGPGGIAEAVAPVAVGLLAGSVLAFAIARRVERAHGA